MGIECTITRYRSKYIEKMSTNTKYTKSSRNNGNRFYGIFEEAAPAAAGGGPVSGRPRRRLTLAYVHSFSNEIRYAHFLRGRCTYCVSLACFRVRGGRSNGFQV
ncbi:hypothetical protein EVAR_45544_1 [Eumeta japonica]|uniref:Uncharacterized protein n=1 Tax=Eumeta variegata TaxID=151549 RepID=A0A4C1XAF5_EUMVA|nr:hypothetical protein EVAR_45544_1 [Eumeta japonica]